MKLANGHTSISATEVRNAIRRMVQTNDNATRLHSETLAATRNMGVLSNDALVDLHWEVYHQIND